MLLPLAALLLLPWAMLRRSISWVGEAEGMGERHIISTGMHSCLSGQAGPAGVQASCDRPTILHPRCLIIPTAPAQPRLLGR